MKEIWKDIIGYKGLYQVSNLGNVKSLERKVKHNYGGLKTIKEKILNKSIRNKYYSVSLCKNNNKKSFTIHSLMANSFIMNNYINKNLVVDHIDNNQLNNNLNNLQLITQLKNNSKDKVGVSKYTGVSWCKRNKKWLSSSGYKGIRKHLGYFDCEFKAHLSYIKYIKSFSC